MLSKNSEWGKDLIFAADLSLKAFLRTNPPRPSPAPYNPNFFFSLFENDFTITVKPYSRSIRRSVFRAKGGFHLDPAKSAHKIVCVCVLTDDPRAKNSCWGELAQRTLEPARDIWITVCKRSSRFPTASSYQTYRMLCHHPDSLV